MNDNFNTRMILTTAAFAAVAALLVGPASAHVMDIEGGGVDESQSSGQPSVELSGDTALKVDRAVAAANEAYDTYRDKTATAARATLAQPSAANARVPADTSSAFAAQESLRIGRYLPQVVVQIRSNGQLAGTQSRAGSTRYGYVVAGGLITP